MIKLILFIFATFLSNICFSQSKFVYDLAGNRIKRLYEPRPDLSPAIDFDQTHFGSETINNPVDYLIFISEQNNIATSGEITLVLNKPSAFNITYPITNGNTTVGGGTSYSNGSWSFTENSNFIICKTSQSIPGNSSLAVCIRISRKSNISQGTIQNLTAGIIAGSGNEVNSSNNQSVVTIIAQ